MGADLAPLVVHDWDPHPHPNRDQTCAEGITFRKHGTTVFMNGGRPASSAHAHSGTGSPCWLFRFTFAGPQIHFNMEAEIGRGEFGAWGYCILFVTVILPHYNICTEY